jgi:hypothetical protein
MKSQRSSFLIAAVIALLLAVLACNAPSENSTPDLAGVVAQTQTALAVQQFLTATTKPPESLPPTVTPANPPAIPSPATPTALPPTATPETGCTNQAKFVNETIPDGTSFSPEEKFTKSWTLQNVGTCTWTPDYSLVFVNGEQMGGASPGPLGKTVTPNGTIEVTVNLTAPKATGEYQGFWKLSTPQGVQFALGKDANTAFWVKINVATGSSPADLNLGAPTWVNSFDSKPYHFYIGADDDVSFEVKDGNMVLTAFTAVGDQWRVSDTGYIDNFYLEARYKTGSACAGEDSYGLIVRAPDQPNNIIDSGYVFTFSCSGKYRVYLMVNGGFSSLLNWSANGSIKAGANQSNTMGIQAKGDKFQFFANGKLVAEFSDSTYASGYFGLVIRSKATQGFRVLVSEISYWDLP